MTEELTWFEQEVIVRKRMLVGGHLERIRGRDDSMHCHLNGVQIVELPEGGFVFVSTSYTRNEGWPRVKVEVPKLSMTAEWAETLDEAVAVWKKTHFSGHWTDGGHDSVRVTLGLGGPAAKLSDPWLLYHLGVFAQLVREASIPTPQGEFVRAQMVRSLEAIATTRIKRLADAIGRS